jgi:hypothetical protein
MKIHKTVAQVCNLPYRTFSICVRARTTLARQISKRLAYCNTFATSHAQPITNRRYSRLKICATVAQIFNLRACQNYTAK